MQRLKPAFWRRSGPLVALQFGVWLGTVLSVALYISGAMSVPLGLIVLLYIVFTFWHRQKVASVFQKAQDLALPVDGLIPLFSHIETKLAFGPFTDILKRTLNEKPSQLFRRIGLIVSMMSTQGHPLVHLAVSILLPWEFWVRGS